MLVGSHWCTYSIVMIQERNQRCIWREYLWWIYIDMCNIFYMKCNHLIKVSCSNTFWCNISKFICRYCSICYIIFFIQFWRNIFNFCSNERLYFYSAVCLSIHFFDCCSCFFVYHIVFSNYNFLCFFSFCIQFYYITISYPIY